MRYTTSLVLASAFVLATSGTAGAQIVGVYVGPQISGLGIGVSAQAKLTQLSVSGEFGIVPVNNIKVDSDDLEYQIDTRMGGGLLMLNFHPGFFGMTIGGGVLIGGYNASGDADDLVGQVEIGNGMYEGADVGSLEGKFDFGGPAPALMIGRRSGGLNVGVGLAFTGSPKITLKATGAIANDPQFMADIEAERMSAQDELDKIPFLPMIRIGWQFGLGI